MEDVIEANKAHPEEWTLFSGTAISDLHSTYGRSLYDVDNDIAEWLVEDLNTAAQMQFAKRVGVSAGETKPSNQPPFSATRECCCGGDDGMHLLACPVGARPEGYNPIERCSACTCARCTAERAFLRALAEVYAAEARLGETEHGDRVFARGEMGVISAARKLLKDFE